MRCADCRPLVSKYVDGEALAEEREQVEAHIGSCRACSKLLVQYRMARARVGTLPHYQPDPGLRGRLFSSMETGHAQPEEIVITRRPAPAKGPFRYGARPFAGLLGNLASAFALLVVVSAGLLVWQISGGGPNAPIAYATGTPPVMAVPTGFVPLAVGNGSLPDPQGTAGTGIAHPGAAHPATAGAHAASPTATFWNASEDPKTVHSVRDEIYGYQFQYPAGWWTATSLSVAGSTGLLARRLLRPWSQPDGKPADYAITLDVLGNPDQVTPANALRNLSLRASWKEDGPSGQQQPVTYNGLDGFTLLSADGSKQATYLFAGPLVYRVSLLIKTPPHASPIYTPVPGDGMPGAQVVDQVLYSFRSDAQAASRSATGYLPVLCIHGGEVWAADLAGGPPQPVTRTGGQVRSYALAPDLSQLALIVSDNGHQQLEIDSLSGTNGTVLWITNEIQAVAWDGDQALIALGGAPGGDTPFGLYRLWVQKVGSRQRLADFSSQPSLVHTASSLSVAPDRQWISFLAGDNGPNLYTIRPGGQLMGALQGAGVGPLQVTQYAWLPPGEAEMAPRMMLVANRQVQQLTLPGPGASAPQMKQITTSPNTTFGDLLVAASGEVVALAWVGSATKVYVQAPQGPAGGRLMDLAVAPVTGSLSLAATGRELFYQQALGAGAERTLMVDVANGDVHPLGEMPR